MITGNGVDIVEIKRLEAAVKRWGKAFLNRVFTPRELAYAKTKKHPFQHLAARFAAKEAVYKALGKKTPLNFQDIEILNDKSGAPRCRIKNKTSPVFLSLSHTHRYAVASAIFQKRPSRP